MIGQTIGKYRILEKLGRGGMGTVYKAVDETLGRNVAVKVLNPELAQTDVMKRFEVEARTLAKLSHPEIATIHEIHRTDSQVLMVMEYVPGETLDELLKRSGVLPPERAAYLVAQVLGALAHAHSAGVVHRDLKPSNVMVTESGAVKVLDFGIARVAGAERMTAAGFMVGTPAYMSPESVMGSEVDGRADLYSAGVLFYRLITGHLPFQAGSASDMVEQQLSVAPTPARAHRPDLPEWCDAVLLVALAKAPADRFQSADAFQAALLEGIASVANEQTAMLSTAELAPPERPASQVDAHDVTMAVASPIPDAIGSTALTPTLAAIPQAESTDRMPFVTPSGVARSSAMASGVAPLVQEVVDETRAVPVPVPTSEALAETISFPSHQATPFSGATATTAVAAAPTPRATSTPSGTALVVPRKQFAIAGVVLAALAVGVLVLAVVVLRRSASSSPNPEAPASLQTVTPPTPAASPQDGVAVAAPTVPALEPSAPPERSAPSTAVPALPRPAPPSSVASRTPTPVEAVEPVVSTATHPTPSDTTPFRFDAKAIVAEGDKRRERDASVLIADGSVTVTQKNDTALYALPVSGLISITISNSKQPVWDSPNGPAEAMKVESGAFGFLRGGGNWLGLRTNDALLFLRLDDEIVGRVVAGVQARTGLTVARLAEPKE